MDLTHCLEQHTLNEDKSFPNEENWSNEANVMTKRIKRGKGKCCVVLESRYQSIGESIQVQRVYFHRLIELFESILFPFTSISSV